DSTRQPPRRMAELLDLCGEGAAAAFLQAGDNPAADPAGDREEEAVPFDRRIALRLLPVEQVAVFDEQQAADDKIGNALVIGIDPLGKFGAIDLVAVAVVDPEAGLVLFLVDREGAELDEAEQALGPARLFGYLEAVLLQRAYELRQLEVAKALVIGTVLRKPDRLTLPGLQTEAETSVEALEHDRLNVRCLHLPVCRPAEQAHDR